MCSECRPNLIRCPICDVKYRSGLPRNFFAEKLLDHVERSCRFESFGCDHRYQDCDTLVQHEETCDKKPPIPEKRKKPREDQQETDEVDDNDSDEDTDEDEDEDDNDELELDIEDLFVANFAFILVLLRAYIIEFVDYSQDPKEADSFNFEYLLIFLLVAWLYHSWHDNNLHLLHETSPYIAAWFMSVVTLTVYTKLKYSPWSGQSQLETYRLILSYLKPLVTLLTGLFSSLVHIFVHQLWREENHLILGCVLFFSTTLSSVELYWSLQVKNIKEYLRSICTLTCILEVIIHDHQSVDHQVIDH